MTPVLLLAGLAAYGSSTGRPVAWVYVVGAVAVLVLAFRPGLLGRWWAWVGVGVATLAGLLAGLAYSTTTIGCAFCVTRQHGYPFPWLSEHATYDSLPEGYQAPSTFSSDAVWSVGTIQVLADLLFAACVAITLAVSVSSAVALVRRSAGRRSAVAA